MKQLITMLALFLAAANAEARDLFNFHSLGFSNDGKYYAFVESATQDGSGFPSADAAVIEVATNSMVKRKRVILEGDLATEAQAISKAVTGVNLAGYGITGNRKGETLLVRQLSDRSTYTDTVFSATYYRDYSLTAQTIQETNPNPRCFINEFGSLLKLTLIGSEANPLNLVLQHDTVLPEKRECASNYEIRRVILSEDKLVVVVSYHTPGFEGSDVHFMAVTTKQTL